MPWPAVLAAALFVHGLFIAPTFAATYELIPAAAPARLTEAFAWMSTAIVGGVALGSALAGSVVAGGGPAVGFGLALAATAGARLVAGRARRVLPRTRPCRRLTAALRARRPAGTMPATVPEAR